MTQIPWYNDSQPIKEQYEEYWLVLTYDEKPNQWIVVELKNYYALNKEFMFGNDVVKSEF